MQFVDKIFHKQIGNIAISTVANGFFSTQFHKDSYTILTGHIHDTYIGCCSYRDGIKKGRGKKEDVVGLHAFWVDLDFQDEAHKKKGLPTQQVCDKVLESFPTPTIQVHSGYGYHLWYVLKDSVEVGKDAALWEARIKNFQDHFRKHFVVDSTHNLDRVLRIPDTMNLKRETRKLVTAEYNDCLYDWTDLAQDVEETPHNVTTITSNGNAPVEKIKALMASSEGFRDVYSGKEAPGDGTPSAVDFSIAIHCLKSGFDGGEVKETIISSHIGREGKRNKKHSRQDYFDRTITKAKLVVESELLIGIKVSKIVKFDGDEPCYLMYTDKGIVKFDCAAELLSVSKFGLKVFEALNFIPDLPKQKDWKPVVGELLNKIEIIDMGREGSEQGIIEGFLEDYQESEGVLEDEIGKIFKFNNKLCLSLTQFRHWMDTQKRHSVPEKKLALLMRMIGFESERVFIQEERLRVWTKRL